MSASAPDVDFSLADPANLHHRRFYPAMARIREHSPLYWSARQQAWLVTRHADVMTALRDPRWSNRRFEAMQFSGVSEADLARLPLLQRYVPDWIISVDGARHAKLRKPLMSAFSTRVMSALLPNLQAACDELVGEALERGEFDYAQVIGSPLPSRVIVDLLGLPREVVPKVRGWTVAVTNAMAILNAPLQILLDGEQAMREMTELFIETLDYKARHPGPDVLSALVRARAEDPTLTMEEVLGICHITIIGGHDTTANSLAMGLVAMLDHPTQMALYRDGQVEGIHAMTEMLRFVGAFSGKFVRAAEPMEWFGQTIAQDQLAFIALAAADRDPRVFERPDEMDFRRANADRLATFGPGVHHCVGHYLARLELDTLFRTLFKRTRSIEVTTDEVEYQPNFVFRGFQALPVRVR